MNPNQQRNAVIAGVVAAVVIGGGALFLNTNPSTIRGVAVDVKRLLLQVPP